MSEIVQVVTVRACPGREQEAVDALAACMPPTHTEAGCLRYALHRRADDPAVLCVIERWASFDALEEHRGQPYILAIHERASELFCEHSSFTYEAVPTGDPAKGQI
ncbi:MAG: putative quinol monooxygenase [Solirubrobacteraceae bacterium]